MTAVLIVMVILPFKRVGTLQLLGYGIMVITPYHDMVCVYSISTVIVGTVASISCEPGELRFGN